MNVYVRDEVRCLQLYFLDDLKNTCSVKVMVHVHPVYSSLNAYPFSMKERQLKFSNIQMLLGVLVHFPCMSRVHF